MSPMKFKNFVIIQPILVLLAVPLEMESCDWAAKAHPTPTAAAFLPLQRWGMILGMAAMPINIVNNATGSFSLAAAAAAAAAAAGADESAALHACHRVYGFLFTFLAGVMTCYILWWLEKKSWKRFLSPTTPIENIAWPGCPPVGELRSALEEVRYEEAAMRLQPQPWWEGVFMVSHAVIAAGLLWQVLDLFL